MDITLDGVFLVMIAFGILVLLLTTIFGDIGDGLDGDGDGPSFASVTFLSTAILFVGLVGHVSIWLGFKGWLALIFAVVLGFILAYAVKIFVFKPLMNQQFSTTHSDQSYIGSVARVTIPITPGNTGEVSFTNQNGSLVHIPATSIN